MCKTEQQNEVEKFVRTNWDGEDTMKLIYTCNDALHVY